MIAACVLAALGMRFVVDAARALVPIMGVAILSGAVVVGRSTDRPRLALGATAFLQMTLFTIVGVVLAYVFAARGAPLWDASLAAADSRIGLDWPAIFAAADRWPVALWIGAVAYHGLTLQMIACIVILSATRRAQALRLAVVAAIASGFVTIAISAVMPAMGNVFDPAGYRHLWPSIAWMERDLITGLRDGSGRVLDLSQLMGIVTFPSYHATLPVILAWALRDVRGVRVAAPIVAAMTVLATPLFGGHYGVDVAAGLTLAGVAIVLAPYIVTKRTGLIRPFVQRRAASSVSIAAAAPAAPPAVAMSAPIRTAA